MASDAIIRARIESSVKDRANRVFQSMGITASDGIRMFLTHVAAEGALPFAVDKPNAVTIAAMRELDEGRGTKFPTLDALLEDLEI